jgi:hypothetical protein
LCGTVGNARKAPNDDEGLSAYLRTRHTSLSAAIAMIGLDQKCLASETISDDIVGRIARLYSLTPEGLAALAAPFATA